MGDFFGGDRTDLALEINEDADKNDTAYSGVRVRECTDGVTGIRITKLSITTGEGEKLFGKERGNYVTIEADDFGAGVNGYDERLTGIVAEQLQNVLEPMIVDNKSILVIGLGNKDITADSLGPRTVDGLLINRHILMNTTGTLRLSALTPGVMAQTGMETSGIVKGIVNTSKPGAVVVIDALAARNAKHLNRTFQISDRGINPGSGVGNHRSGITSRTVGVPVVALGVPTVIEMNNMLVTPKDVDIVVRACADILSAAINDVVYA